MNNLKRMLALFFFTLSTTHAVVTDQDCKAFLDSFVTHYECSPEGRYTHEYHPFLLQWTAQSLDQLEAYLHKNDFSLRGRIVIMGYEENAVPRYYTNFTQAKIDDEAIRKNQSGWSLRLHNRFGFMTGFLLKHVNLYGLPAHNVFQHIDADMLPIFDDRAVIFHEHAFGSALPIMRSYQDRTISKLLKQDSRGVLKDLQAFWQILYSHAFTVGNQQVAGTQDVLFSIEYANHLMRSSMPLIKFFVGPDITYPIEITTKQQGNATIHSQNFVRIFEKGLQPINNENTVYIFCSFVDGVGKSTMLGNIKNWMRFGGDVDKFQHVDNSSSQLAELFQFKDKVFIADLPAQVSHFTYKPDGQVYVDVRTNCTQEEFDELDRYVNEHRQELREAALKTFDQAREIIEQKGLNASELSDVTSPALGFAKNVIMLKKETTNNWYPFEYMGMHYLFRDGKPIEIRYLTKLCSVKSEGLKNIEAEQMLFFDGIRLPLPYQVFQEDLTQKFKNSGIKNVVFVDFLSMYPRSSRENIRVNYLLQQMACLDDKVDPRYSLYRDFVSGGELLHMLLHPKTARKLHASLEQEAMVRLSLFHLLVQRSNEDLTGVGLHELTTRLQALGAPLHKQFGSYAGQLVAKKLHKETNGLEKLYGLSKSFVNVQELSFSKACAFSTLMQELCSELIDHENINELWADPGLPIMQTKELFAQGGRIDDTLTTNKNVSVKAFCALHPDCKDELLLTPCIRSLRASWYASLLNLLCAADGKGDKVTIEQEYFKVVPLFLKAAYDGYIYLLQRSFPQRPEAVSALERLRYRPVHLASNKAQCYVELYDDMYRVDWDARPTNVGLLGFDCELSKEDNKRHLLDLTPLSFIVQKHHQTHGQNTVMPAIDVWEALHDDSVWQETREEFKVAAKKNGQYPGLVQAAKRQVGGSRMFVPIAPLSIAKRVFVGNSFYRPIVQLMVRLLATLEMVVKDPDADVVIRDMNHDDFKAALKLFEQVVLPTYCGIVFFDDLFDDYNTVEPYPSWEYWEQVA